MWDGGAGREVLVGVFYAGLVWGFIRLPITSVFAEEVSEYRAELLDRLLCVLISWFVGLGFRGGVWRGGGGGFEGFWGVEVVFWGFVGGRRQVVVGIWGGVRLGVERVTGGWVWRLWVGVLEIGCGLGRWVCLW